MLWADMQMIHIVNLKAQKSVFYKGSNLLAADYAQQIAGLVHIEYNDRQLILHTQRKSRHVHHP